MQYSTVAGTRGICPAGWHIPTLTEYQTLGTEVNSNGNALKEIGQGSGAGTGTNTSGFSALLGGYRTYHAYFFGLGYNSNFWSSTGYDATNANYLFLNYENSGIYLYYNLKEGGYSVRCVMDNAVGVDDKDKSELPKEFFLLQNYPNPFNPQTKISFSVPKESYITLKVYDLLGREVTTLLNEKKQQGEYSVAWSAEGVTSGVYYYRLVAIDPSLRSGQVFVETKKMVVMK